MTSRSKKYNYNINASGNFATNNLNLGVSNVFSGSFSASNNIVSPTDVTGLVFSNSDVRFFQCQLTVNITRSSGGNLYELFTLEGHQIDSGWNLYVTSLSDITGIVFTITSSGQIQYTSTNVGNFVNSVFRYIVTQISNTGTYSNLSTGTQGTYILNSLQLTNTEGSVLTSNPGALYVMGGSTFEKMITIKTTDNVTGFGTGGGLSIFGGAAISKDVIINGNVGIGKANPTTRLDVNGSMSLNGDLFVTGTLTSVNVTTTNVVDTNISTGTLTSTNQNSTNVTTATLNVTTGITSSSAQITNANVTTLTAATLLNTDQNSTNVTTATLNATTGITTASAQITNANVTTLTAATLLNTDQNSTNVTTATLNATTGITTASAQITNANVTTQTVSTARITSNLLALGNSNTIGNIFTTGGNVGIGMTPQAKLDVWGDIGLPYGSAIRIGAGSNWSSGTTKLIESGWDINGMSGDCTSIYTPGAANSTPRINVSSNGKINFDGNVGIGTKSPGAKLEIADGANDVVKYGTLQITQDDTTIVATANNVAQISFVRSGNYVHGLGYLRNSTTFGFGQGQVANVGTFSPNFLAIKTNGNVGIGTTDPGNILQVGSGGRLRISNGATDYTLIGTQNVDDATNTRIVITGNTMSGYNGNIEYMSTNTGSHKWFTTNSATEQMCLTSAGNLGVGTSSPTVKLHVSGASIIESGNLTVRNDGGYGSIELKGTTGSFIDMGPDSIDFRTRIMHNESNRSLVFQVNGGTVAMAMASSGNVGVGTTSPASKLDVSGTVRATGSSTPTSGVGLEMFWESYNNTSYLLSYNRNTGAYQPLVISGSPIYIENCTTYMSQNLNNSDPSVALYGRAVGVSGTADNTQQPMIRLFRGGTGGVQNSVAANILFGSNTANIDGISNVRFQLSSSPVSGNGWGSSADTTVMTLVGNGNVGIGTTSPSNRFHVHSSSYPNIKLTTDDNYVTAIDFDSTNKTGGKHWRIMSTHQSAGEGQGKFCIQNVTDGVVRMAIQAGGEVGIGTNTPSYKLHVSGDVYANTYRVAGNAAVYWESWGGGWYMVDSAWVRTYNEKNIWSGAGNICTAGRIGVGLADPVTKLHIFESSGTQAGADAGSIILDHDNSGGASSITFRSKVNRSSDYGYIQYQDAISVGVGGESSRLIIGTQNDGDDHIILSPSGSVGVGTNSPIAKLHVAGTGYFTGPGGGGTNGSVLITGSDLWGHSLYVATSQVQKRLAFNHDGGSANIFSYDYGSSVAQNLVLQSPGGNLLIGNTLAIFYPSGGDKFVVHANGSNGNNGYFYYNASNNYGTASDRRIKDNIVAINEETAMSFIETLEPSEFTMVNQTTQMSGFIAQNVLNAAQTDGQRSSVNNWQSFDENDPDSPLLGVSDRPILANLVSAFKKLRKEYLITRQQLDAKTNELDTLKEFLRTKFPGEI